MPRKERSSVGFWGVLKPFDFLKGEGETISREYVNEELDAWLVEPTFRRIVGHGQAGLVKSAERLVEWGVVFVLVSAI